MLNLYPHNSIAYNNAVEALKTSNKTCIIHPTGTGKSLIIANFIENNPTKKHLLLAPGTHIFNEIKKHTALHFETSTYQNLIFNSAEKLNLLECDFIYLDEFHRIGAIEWGNHLKKLLNLNPKALILGTTATHIRFLDDNRNMAEEIFNNNISSQLNLQEAIQSKILQAPKYIAALFSISEMRKSLSDKILKSNHKNKINIVDQLQKSMIDWEKSNGIEQILSKHLTNDRNKILVFCRTKKHIDQMESIVMNGIKKVLPNAVSLHIYSKFSTVVNEEALLQFSIEDDIPKVLFTVAMINEGLHVKGNNTVILIRDTSSPIIYFQQIGRAFSVNQTQKPLIFDLVNNFDVITGTLYDKYADFRTEDGSTTSSNTTSSLADLVEVEFFDEIKDLAQMFQTYYQKINPWEIQFAEATLFYTQHGHLNPSRGTSLSNWISVNRSDKKNNILAADKINKLESIGITWEINESLWNDMFVEAQLYYKENGHLNTNYKTTLYNWLMTNRKLKAANMISEERFLKLESLGIVWSFEENSWNKMYEKAKHYSIENGHLNPQERSPLLYWIMNNKVLKNKKLLTEKRVQLLENIGIKWNISDDNWNRQFEEAKLFYTENGHLNITKGSPLYHFILVNKQSKKRNTLSKERVQKLESIGMIWNALEDAWNKMFEEAKKYFIENGDLNLKIRSPLYNWLIANRKMKITNSISKERIDKLERIGIDWNPLEANWNEQFEEAKLFFKINGHLNFKYRSSMSNWIIRNRAANRSNNITADRKYKLESIGMLWNANEEKWNQRFKEAKLFYKENGHINLKNRSALSYWIVLNRKNKELNKLTKARIDLLDSIGMVWKPMQNM